MKKLAVLFAALMFATGIVPAQASSAPANIAIIDTGFESSRISNVVHEVCVVSFTMGCNNNTGLQEGPGAAGSSTAILARFRNDWNHGTIMADIVNQVAPDAGLVLVRNARVIRGNVLAGTLDDFSAALNWIERNAEKYNIVAVSFSRGSDAYFKSLPNPRTVQTRIDALERAIAVHKSNPARAALVASYEAIVLDLRSQLSGVPACPNHAALEAQMYRLAELNIVTAIAAGNSASRTNVNEPACLSSAVAISTRSQFDNRDGTANVTLNSNISADTPFAVPGTYNTKLGRVADSSSAATAAFAAIWTRNFVGSYQQTLKLLKQSGIPVANYNAVALSN